MGINMTAVSGGGMQRATYDSDADDKIDTAKGGLDADVSGYTGYLYLTSGVTSQDTIIAHTTNGLSVTGASSQTGALTHDGTDLSLTTSTGDIKLAVTGGSGASNIKISDGSSNYLTLTIDSLSSDYTWKMNEYDRNRVVVLKAFADSAVISQGNGALHFAVPEELNGMNLVTVGGHVSTVDASNAITINIYNVTDSQNMLSTALTIDANEKDSATATTPAVINTSYDDIATGDELRVDVTTYAGAAAKGLEVRLGFQLP